MSELNYDLLAPFYDSFQTTEDPEAWAAFLDAQSRFVAQEPSRSEGQGAGGRALAVDLGCGTGRIARAMQKRGWDIIGIDYSANMLSEAGQAVLPSENEGGPSALFLLQDLTRFELFGSVNLIYATMDTFNHITAAELERTLALCANYLHPGGVLIFDLLSLDYMQEEMGSEFYYDISSEHAVLWQNAFDKELRQNVASVTIFTEEAELYRREELEIVEYYHEPDAVLAALERLGFRTAIVKPESGLLDGIGAARRYFFVGVRRA